MESYTDLNLYRSNLSVYNNLLEYTYPGLRYIDYGIILVHPYGPDMDVSPS